MEYVYIPYLILPTMKLLTTRGKTLIIAALLILGLASCKKDEVMYTPAIPGNLVIVTDNDPGSYIMVKIMGAVRSSFPDIHITYLQSKQFDVFEGAFLLNTSLESFPAGTVIAGIIEPGADSRRFVFQAGSRRVFSPDNTLSTLILHDYPGTACYFVENPAVLGGAEPKDLSFEEFYAQAICSLISTAPGTAFGPLCSNPKMFPVQDPVVKGDTILGEIMFTDNFGNCITNIPDSLTVQLRQGTMLTMKSDTVQAGMQLGLTYSSVPVGDNVCFINSLKLLELAVNFGNFSVKYNLGAGNRVKLYRQ